MQELQDNTRTESEETKPTLTAEWSGGADDGRRFYVRAKSVNAVRRALFRAPGGARVVGRCDRETIECSHTMDSHSLQRLWPIILSRLEKASLQVVDRQR